MTLRTTLIPLVLALGACSSLDSKASRAPLFDGMGEHARAVSTTEPMAQRYFDQGLALAFGFNHDEAIRSFVQARKIDPDCAMAWWGEAYALGPNYNLRLDEANGKKAHAAIQEAMKRKASATQVERDLIDALATRYASPPPSDRKHLDEAYAAAMGALWAKYRRDGDIGFLYADAMLNLSPWDQWTKDGKARPNTLKIVSVLEEVLSFDTRHPGANHMYIHTMEASSQPERAEAAADRLGALSPGIGHMVHMPSHIYMRVGRYADSVACNEKASALDREYFRRVGMKGIYHFYHGHNNHFIVWSEMFRGRYEAALAACRRTIDDLPKPFHGEAGVAEWFVMDLHVHLRFGRWTEVLKTARPRSSQPYAIAIWHYARGMAYANTGRLAQARREAAEFEAAAAEVPKEQMLHVIPAHDVLEVARRMLAGETAFKSGDHATAFTHLRAAVVAEDALRYTEPNPWMMPSRHALGALLLDRGRLSEAEQCYRHDLKRYPKNGWSLHGLEECLRRQGKTASAEAVAREFREAWADATVKIEASCFCSEGG